MNELNTVSTLLFNIESIKSNQQLLPVSKGVNRAPLELCQIEALTDVEAIEAWLREYNHTLNTQRIYRKEGERLLLWCVFNQKKSLTELKRDDFEVYVHFLADPQPRHLWCGKSGGRNNIRGSTQWRPFTRPLKSKSIRNTLTILNSLFSFLVDAGFLITNPLKLMRRLQQQEGSLEERALLVQERILEPEEWQAMIETLESMPENSSEEVNDKKRLRLIVYMLFFLGLRVGELCSHSWSAFRKIENNWWFIVRGKGNKLGKIPVNGVLWCQVLDFRMHCGLCPVPKEEESAPIIPSWRSDNGLQARQVNKVLKDLAILTAEKFKDNPRKINKLKGFSAHWLRHLSATMQEHAGIGESHIMANMRHENMITTRLYIHKDEMERHDKMQLLNLNSQSRD